MIMDDFMTKEEVSTQEPSKEGIKEIIETLEGRQNQLLAQLNKLNLMNLRTNARISELEKSIEGGINESEGNKRSYSSDEFHKLKSEVDEVKKDLELISEFLLNNETNKGETSETEEDSKIVREDRDVEQEIEILNNKVEGVMDRLNTVLNIGEPAKNSPRSNADQTSSANGEISDNARTILKKLKEMDDVSVDKLEENTGMTREEIKSGYKELKQKGKI